MSFSSIQMSEILQYAKDQYESKPEFLWLKSPNNAVLRHKDSLKWYAVLITVSKSKLGLDGDESVEILGLKCTPLLIDGLVDKVHYFPAYHMNKQHWISILLDNTLPINDILNLMDLSFSLTKK